jgi:hypothetical protein
MQNRTEEGGTFYGVTPSASHQGPLGSRRDVNSVPATRAARLQLRQDLRRGTSDRVRACTVLSCQFRPRVCVHRSGLHVLLRRRRHPIARSTVDEPAPSSLSSAAFSAGGALKL